MSNRELAALHLGAINAIAALPPGVKFSGNDLPSKFGCVRAACWHACCGPVARMKNPSVVFALAILVGAIAGTAFVGVVTGF